MCVCVCVHITQHSTEQFCLSSLLSSRQAPELTCGLQRGGGLTPKIYAFSHNTPMSQTHRQTNTQPTGRAEPLSMSAKTMPVKEKPKVVSNSSSIVFTLLRTPPPNYCKYRTRNAFYAAKDTLAAKSCIINYDIVRQKYKTKT